MEYFQKEHPIPNIMTQMKKVKQALAFKRQKFTQPRSETALRTQRSI